MTTTIGNYTLSLREFNNDAHLPPHVHADSFVTVIAEGRLLEESCGKARECAAQSLIVHAPGERHANRFAGRRTRCLRVQGVAFERTELLASPCASAIASKLLREFRAPDELSPMVVEAAMLELFVITARQATDTRPPRWLLQVAGEVDDRFQEPLTLAGLAQSAGVHPGHLARAFRKHTGVTLGERLRARRVAYARERLASADALQSIAADAGFADQSHFTRTFRRAMGMTPAAYRRALRG